MMNSVVCSNNYVLFIVAIVFVKEEMYEELGLHLIQKIIEKGLNIF